VRHPLRLVALGAQILGEVGEVRGGVLGDLLPGQPGLEPVGLVECPLQPLAVSRLA
jgi:hypothetical protein